MINVENIILDPDFQQPLMLKRQSGSFVDGEWTLGTGVISTVYGSWQKASADELSLDSKGEVQEEIRKLITTIEMKVDDAGNTSDRIIDGTRQYKVIKVDRWNYNGFYRAYATFEDNVNDSNLFGYFDVSRGYSTLIDPDSGGIYATLT